MKIAFSWDDGALEDQRLFELHEKHNIPGMFFIPTRNREGREVITPEIMRMAESSYIRFGGHTENHTYLTSIPLSEVDKEVLLNKDYLENALGHEIEDFCLPGGKYTPEILDVVNKYYKTIRTADTMNFKYSGGILKPAFHFYPRGIKSLLGNAVKNKNYALAIYVALHFQTDYFELIESMIKKEANTDSSLMIWGHSWEIENFQLWKKLEHFMTLDFVRENAVEYSDMFMLEDMK